MDTVLLTVLGIGGATALGAFLGDRFGMLRGRWTRLLQIAGAVMMIVIVVGILFSLQKGEHGQTVLILLLLVIGGAELLGKRMERLGVSGSTKRLRSLLLVAVIAVHHFPEGMAAGISCIDGGASGLAVCGAVVLHTIPEAMVIVPTLRSAGFHSGWGYAAAAVSGLSEISGVLAGIWL